MFEIVDGPELQEIRDRMKAESHNQYVVDSYHYCDELASIKELKEIRFQGRIFCNLAKFDFTGSEIIIAEAMHRLHINKDVWVEYSWDWLYNDVKIQDKNGFDEFVSLLRTKFVHHTSKYLNDEELSNWQSQYVSKGMSELELSGSEWRRAFQTQIEMNKLSNFIYGIRNLSYVTEIWKQEDLMAYLRANQPSKPISLSSVVSESRLNNMKPIHNWLIRKSEQYPTSNIKITCGNEQLVRTVDSAMDSREYVVESIDSIMSRCRI